ncbi:MAG: hypothetical protein ACREA7_10205 [Nitrosotalea sp.]
MSPVHKPRGNKNDLRSISERKIAIRQILDRLGHDHVIDKGFVLQELAKHGFNLSKRTLERDLVDVHRKCRIRKRVRLAYRKEIDYCFRLVRMINRECDMMFAQSKKIPSVTSVTIGSRVTKIITGRDEGQRIVKLTLGALEIKAQVAGMMINMIVRASKGLSVKMYRATLTRKYVMVKEKRIKMKSLVKPLLLSVHSKHLFKKASEEKLLSRKRKIRVGVA